MYSNCNLMHDHRGTDIFYDSEHSCYFWKAVLSCFAVYIVYTYYLQVEEESQISRSTQAEQDQYEMQVRAANIVSVTF